MKVERPNVPLPCTEFLIQPFGPNGISQLLNYDIIEFPEEVNLKSSEIVSKPKKWEGPNGLHSRAGNSTVQRLLQFKIRSRRRHTHLRALATNPRLVLAPATNPRLVLMRRQWSTIADLVTNMTAIE